MSQSWKVLLKARPDSAKTRRVITPTPSVAAPVVMASPPPQAGPVFPMNGA